MSQQNNIGDQIRNAVQDAIANQDYTALRATVEQGINAATETIGRSLANAQAAAQQKAQENAQRQQQKAQRGAGPDAAPAGQRGLPSQQAAERRQQREAAKRQQFAMMQQQRQQAAMARQQQQQALAAVRYRFAKGGSTKAAGIGMTIGGAILALGFAAGGVATLLGTALVGASFIVGDVAMLAGLAGSIGLVVGGSHKIGFADRFMAYKRALGTRQACDVSELQQAVGRSRADVLKDLRKMIAKGMFTQGHLDAGDTQLVVTDEAHRLCLQHEREQAEAERVRRLTQQAAPSAAPAQLSAEQRELLSRGNAYVARIKAINDRIPDPEISAKIRQIETVVQKIFDYAEQHPEVIGDLQRLMDYYLPTTVKLLDAYADLDAQPVQGENIASAKREIEETLDTLSVAFERLLDSIFKDMTWDVSTDISVLHAVLAQEGLVEGAFEGKDSK